MVLPAEHPSHARPPSVAAPTSLRSMVLDDLKAGGSRAALAPVRAAKSLVAGTPYRPTPVQPARTTELARDSRPRIRYVGWTGHHNMGDEAMLQAVTALFDWAEIQTQGDRADLLMLGGGTLINRGYLRQLRPLDSPNLERVAFGPGVANPEYWGEPKEDTADWVDFLDSCAYVGVRGPMSADLLRDWGLRRELEVVGDPALSLRPSPGIERVDGRVIVCPAWSRGLLWGDSDDVVIDAFARLTRELLDRGHDTWVLSCFPGDDRHIIDMMRRADAADLPFMAAHDEPAHALDLMASAELAVSERLHGAVLAAAAGTVPVMVEYRPKLRDFAQSIGLDDLALRTDQLRGGALSELALDAFERRWSLADVMTDRVDHYRTLQARAARAIATAVEG